MRRVLPAGKIRHQLRASPPGSQGLARGKQGRDQPEEESAKGRQHESVLGTEAKALGITPGEYADILARQDNACAICRTKDTGRCKVFSVDHDHKTGTIRGLLCSRCNQGIGLLGDSVERIRKAADYTEAAGLPVMHVLINGAALRWL